MKCTRGFNYFHFHTCIVGKKCCWKWSVKSYRLPSWFRVRLQIRMQYKRQIVCTNLISNQTTISCLQGVKLFKYNFTWCCIIFLLMSPITPSQITSIFNECNVLSEVEINLRCLPIVLKQFLFITQHMCVHNYKMSTALNTFWNYSRETCQKNHTLKGESLRERQGKVFNATFIHLHKHQPQNFNIYVQPQRSATQLLHL